MYTFNELFFTGMKKLATKVIEIFSTLVMVWCHWFSFLNNSCKESEKIKLGFNFIRTIDCCNINFYLVTLQFSISFNSIGAFHLFISVEEIDFIWKYSTTIYHIITNLYSLRYYCYTNKITWYDQFPLLPMFRF